MPSLQANMVKKKRQNYVFKQVIKRSKLSMQVWFYLLLYNSFFVENNRKKSRIRETPTLSLVADSRTDTNLKRLCDLSQEKKEKKEKKL